MRILICPDSFKGSLSATEAARAIAEGLGRIYPDSERILLPLADGGEGTVEALVTASHGEIRTQVVKGPRGADTPADFGILPDGTAVIEMAAASGLPLLPDDQRDPRFTTTYGTGELIRTALDAGCRKLIIGIGGSATNDGGVGAMSALGVRFLDANGEDLAPGGADLVRLARIDVSGLDPRIKETQVEVACDVTNPLCGPLGASAVYGPQKGATPEMVTVLDEALCHYGRIAEEALGMPIVEVPGAGAAGGLGAALLGFMKADLQSGIDIVLRTVRFEEQARDADLIATGEGKLDQTTAHGKAIKGIVDVAHRMGVPVIAFAGAVDCAGEQVVDAAASIVARPMPLSDAMQNAYALLSDSASRMARALQVGQRLGC